MSSKEERFERIYTVPFSRVWLAPSQRRSTRAINILRAFAVKHMKSNNVKIKADVNEMIWRRGIRTPPRRIQVRMVKDEDGIVEISLPIVTTQPEEPTESKTTQPEEPTESKTI